MALRWKKSEKSNRLSSIGDNPRTSTLSDGNNSLMHVYPVGGSWSTGNLKGWKFKITGNMFGDLKFKVSTKLFETDKDAKISARKFVDDFIKKQNKKEE